ncbi:MAG: hypothetical protein GY772_29480 [bacterium]|nr:hypothetical protein [bacterium]
MRRPIFGNGYPKPLNPGEEVVVFDASQAEASGSGAQTFFLTLYYYFSPEVVDGGGAGFPANPVLASIVNVPEVAGGGLPVIDGVPTAAGNLVLLTAQDDPSLNGFWTVVAAGDWTRPAAPAPAAYLIGSWCTVTAGDTLAGVNFTYTGPDNSPAVLATPAAPAGPPLEFVSNAGVNAQVYVDQGPGTNQILLEDIDNQIALLLFGVDKGAVLAVDRLPLSGTGRLIVKSEPMSSEKFWLLGYFERGVTGDNAGGADRILQPDIRVINSNTAFELTTGGPVAAGGLPVKAAIPIHQVTTEYIDEITIFAGVSKNADAEPATPIVVEPI